MVLFLKNKPNGALGINNYLLIMTLVLLTFFLLGCKGETGEVKVGFIGPLTGDAAIIGQENLNGITLAVEEFNARSSDMKINLVVKDDRMEEKETITQYQQLVDLEDVHYILTVTYGGFLSLAERAEQNDIILIDSLDASEELAQLGDNSFAIGIYDESIGHVIADYLHEKGVGRVGLISNLEDPFILLVKNAFKEKYTGDIKEEDYNFNDKDFRTILTKLSSHDYIVLLGWEETGLAIRQAKELAMTSTFIGIDTFSSENFRANTNDNYEELLFTFWQGNEENPLYEKVITSYTSEFQKQPDNVLFVATGYDAMMILGENLRICGDDVSCVKGRLRSNVKDFKGATGLITLDPDGITRSIRETIHTYHEGKIVPVPL